MSGRQKRPGRGGERNRGRNARDKERASERKRDGLSRWKGGREEGRERESEKQRDARFGGNFESFDGDTAAPNAAIQLVRGIGG